MLLMLYRLHLAYHKYHCGKCLVVDRRIFGRNVVRGGGWYIVYIMSIVKVKYTITMLMRYKL